jgi:hypothetical protein
VIVFKFVLLKGMEIKNHFLLFGKKIEISYVGISLTAFSKLFLVRRIF